MVQIRVGVSGLNGSGPAIDLGELVAARHVRWVEIDGVRVLRLLRLAVDGMESRSIPLRLSFLAFPSLFI
jgi:hypothetical protein